MTSPLVAATLFAGLHDQGSTESHSKSAANLQFESILSGGLLRLAADSPDRKMLIVVADAELSLASVLDKGWTSAEWLRLWTAEAKAVIEFQAVFYERCCVVSIHNLASPAELDGPVSDYVTVDVAEQFQALNICKPSALGLLVARESIEDSPEVSALQTELHAVTTPIGASQSEVSTSISDLKSLALQQFRVVREDLALANRRTKELELCNEDSAQKLVRLQDELECTTSELTQEIRRLESEADKFKNEGSHAQRRIEQLELHNEISELQITQLQEELELCNEDSAQKLVRLQDELECTTSELTQQIRRLESEADKLKNEASQDAQRRIEELELLNEISELQIAQLQEELEHALTSKVSNERPLAPVKSASEQPSASTHREPKTVQAKGSNRNPIQRAKKYARQWLLPRSLRAQIKVLQNSSVFDAHWYESAYPDVCNGIMSAEEHYLRFGANEGRDPSAEFSTQRYLFRHPEVRDSNVNPLIHFVEVQSTPISRAEGFKGKIRYVLLPLRVRRQIRRLKECGQFDRDWYLRQYPDVAKLFMSPEEHYLRYGAAEGRNPSTTFNTKAFCAQHPTLDPAKTNPLLHSLQQ